ncbi:hypothetical protein Tco_0306201, partial [Tanacetum coccineum]
DLIFFGGGDTNGGSDDEGSAATNSKNRMIWCGEVGGVEADSSVLNASVSSA